MKKNKKKGGKAGVRFFPHKKKAGGPLASARRDHKDTLFRMLFRDRENLLSLYNAVGGTNYTDPEALKVVTLENAVYMNMKNDLAFLMDLELTLYEHQSTYNPNMPLRDLFYVSREYQSLVKDRTLYSSGLVKIPTPHFVVFYNGTESRPECQILKLSEAFEKPADDPQLELLVTVLNINSGNNEGLLEACRTLKEYMIYVERVRTYARTMNLNQAVERAVDECIKEGILSEFLSKNRAEAIAVSIFEYDEIKEKELMRKAEYEVGRGDGIQEGIQIGIRAMIKLCRELGLTHEETKKRLMENFTITDLQAEEFMGKTPKKA